MEKLYVTYLRVSTREQGVSGLGLESQRSSVLHFISHNGNKILAEFVEIESGKNNNRPELLKAISLCKEKGATLIISKLDRLSRNVHFISALMESKVQFVCCDMVDASPLTIHIFSALAEWERERISQRTKDALTAKKKREPDWKPGCPLPISKECIEKAHASISNKARTTQSIRFAWHFIEPLRKAGESFANIALKLNKEGYLTRTGKQFAGKQVWDIYRRFSNK